MTARANATALLQLLRPERRLGDYARQGEQATTADIRDRMRTALF